MRKIIAGINMTLDGYCDHTAVNADAETHAHYTTLLRQSGTILFGRVTYQLMEDFWPGVVRQPTGDAALDDFARAIDDIPKVVFSRTMEAVNWHNVTLAKQDLQTEVETLRQQPGRDILVGSRSLLTALANLDLIDEYQLCVHPVLAGGGLLLFHDLTRRATLSLAKTRTFGCGAIVLYYSTVR